jgi:hypothetical protein
VEAVDEFDSGFGWIADEFMERCSHALVVDGHVWLIDPLDGQGVEERVREAGQPAGVVQLLARHNRDSAALAERLGVRLHVVPRQAIGSFSFIPIERGPWHEVALWWAERRVLVAADALGTAAYFLGTGDRLAVNPLLRFLPPRKELGALHPDVILCGHGRGVLSEADAALHEALSSARRRFPSQAANAFRAYRARRAK